VYKKASFKMSFKGGGKLAQSHIGGYQVVRVCTCIKDYMLSNVAVVPRPNQNPAPTYPTLPTLPNWLQFDM